MSARTARVSKGSGPQELGRDQRPVCDVYVGDLPVESLDAGRGVVERTDAQGLVVLHDAIGGVRVCVLELAVAAMDAPEQSSGSNKPEGSGPVVGAAPELELPAPSATAGAKPAAVAEAAPVDKGESSLPEDGERAEPAPATGATRAVGDGGNEAGTGRRSGTG